MTFFTKNRLAWLKRRLSLHEEAERQYWGLLLPLFLLTLFSWIDHLIMVPLSAEISAATGFSSVRSGLLVSVYPAAAAVSAFILPPSQTDWGVSDFCST